MWTSSNPHGCQCGQKLTKNAESIVVVDEDTFVNLMYRVFLQELCRDVGVLLPADIEVNVVAQVKGHTPIELDTSCLLTAQKGEFAYKRGFTIEEVLSAPDCLEWLDAIALEVTHALQLWETKP